MQTLWFAASEWATTGQPLLPTAVVHSLTKLRLVNPSKANHYFTALEFADKVFTVLVLVGNPEVEVKGKVQVGGREAPSDP